MGSRGDAPGGVRGSAPALLSLTMRRRTLSEQDRTTWATYAQAIKALPGRAVPELPSAPEIAFTQTAAAPRAPRAIAAAPLAVGAAPGGLDASSWKKLRTGKLTPERTLDLHGRTAQRAFHALKAFLHTAHAERVRCVEVITGRGAGEGGGVLRRELPHWLNLPELRSLVLAASHPHAANTGSVRLLLRRAK